MYSTHNSEFLGKLHGIVLQNLSNDNFGVNDLAGKVQLSRSQLHRKVKQLTGSSVSCFIRQARLQQAEQILLNEQRTISEIAYLVGFGSPSYFNKCFHDYFGLAPGDYKKYHNNMLLDADIVDLKKTMQGPVRNTTKKAYYFFLLVFIILALVLIAFYML
ncbi:AraC family transcriptional regulator [uncultured Draconibacterium sp.]|uniref:helix-turn-helix domain-containing protein n=1 Tax=uncultured Draconibacterium sp. TaxID=1573823 RepID=UPI003260B440